MTATVAEICRYPVKGLSADCLERVTLAAGETLPHDRRFAIAHGTTQFDPAAPKWQSKDHFLMLAKDEKLARLAAAFDAESGELTLERDGKQVTKGKITDPLGRTVIGQFFASFLTGQTRGTPKVVEAPGFSFTDAPNKFVSLINLASIKDLERVARQDIDPHRFRANIYLDGLAPWQEFGWIDRDIKIGGAHLHIEARISRCPATNVNLKTAERDMNIPQLLRKGFGHIDMGVYAWVTTGGDIQAGDQVTLKDG